MSIKECTEVYSMIKKGDNMDEIVEIDESSDEDGDEARVTYNSVTSE